MRPVIKIDETPSNMYTDKDSIYRTSEGTIDTTFFRKELEKIGFEMPSLDVPTKKVEEYFRGEKSSAIFSLNNMATRLPKELTPILSTLSEDDTDYARYVYHELNDVINENRETAYNMLISEIKNEQLFNPEECKTRTEVMNNVFKLINENRQISEKTKFALSHYQEYTWYLLIANHRLIYEISRDIVDDLNLYNIEIPMEDTFQTALVTAFRYAADYDPNKAKYTTYLKSMHLENMIIRNILNEKDITYHTFMFYLFSQNKAYGFLNSAELGDNKKDLSFLTALYFYQIRGMIDFKDEETMLALNDFIKMYESGRKYEPKNLTSKFGNKNIRRMLDKFFLRMESINNLQKPKSIDEGKDISIRDKHGNIYTENLELQIPADSDVLRPVEEEIIDNEFKNKLDEYLKRATISERDEMIIRLRYGLIDGEKRTLKEIAIFYGLTEERVRQIEAIMLYKLRGIRFRQLRDYL